MKMHDILPYSSFIQLDLQLSDCPDFRAEQIKRVAVVF